MTIITSFLNFIHICLLLVPPGIYLVPLNKRNMKFMKIFSKWILLIGALIPLHWVFFDNSCVFTMASQELGNYQEAETTSEFSETNLKWLYQPIMKLFGWPWNNEGLDKMVTLHWVVNIILIWSYCFYFIY
jgi:hypothetical protein